MSSRSRSYTPDRYVPEKYQRKDEDPAAGGPKRASTIAVGYDDHARGRDGRYKSNTSAPRRGTSKIVAKRGMSVPAGKNNDDSEWDTDYDPRDRLYLSPDEDSDSEYERRSSRHRRDSSKRESSRRHSDRHGDPHHDRQRDRDHHSSRRSSHDHGRDHDDHRSTKSSTHANTSRPRAARTASARGRAHRYPPNSSRSDKPQHHHRRSSSGSPVDNAIDGFQKVPWEQVMKTAWKTGTITAIKIAHTPGSPLDKAAKVVSTSVAAAVIDTILTSKESKIRGGVRHAAIRHAAEMALGSMVVGPAVKGLKGK